MNEDSAPHSSTTSLPEQARTDIKQSRKLVWIYKLYAIYILLVTSYILSVSAFHLYQSVNLLKEFLGTFYTGAVLLFIIFFIISIAVSIILFWGTYKLRKWVIPLLVITALFSLLEIIFIFLHFLTSGSPNQIGEILAHSLFIALVLFGLYHRNHFTHSYKKWSLQIFYIAVTLPFFIIGVLSSAFPDLPTLEDSDLYLTNSILPPDQENAYYVMKDVFDSDYKHDFTGKEYENWRKMAEGEMWDQTAASTILEANAVALEKTRRAMEMTLYQCPSTAEDISFSSTLCPLNVIRNYFRDVGNISAFHKAYGGNHSASLEEGLLGLKMGQLMLNQQRVSLIDYLVAHAVKKSSLNTIEKIATQNAISLETTRQISKVIDQYYPHQESLSKALAYEYTSTKNSMEAFLKFNHNFYYQPNRFFTEIANHKRDLISLGSAVCHEIESVASKYDEVDERARENFALWKIAYTQNGFFEIVLRVLKSGSSTLVTKECSTKLSAERAKLQLAISAFVHSTKDYPTSQSELVPLYIDEPILNPMTNLELMFNPNTGKIED